MPGFTTAQAGSAFGGAVWAGGSTGTLDQVVFAGNQAVGADLPIAIGGGGPGAGKGGAWFSSSGAMAFSDCTFVTNQARAGLKGRHGTTAPGQGGAIWASGSLSVLQSTFSANQVIGSARGAIVNGTNLPAGEGSGGAVWTELSSSLVSSVFSENTALGGTGLSISTTSLIGGIGRGGAVCNMGTMAVTNCTFSRNLAQGGNGGISGDAPYGGPGAGGGVFNNGTATLINLTFDSNQAKGGINDFFPEVNPPGPAQGGAICVSNGTVNIGNTIVANSLSGSNAFGVLVDLGYNLSSDASCNFTGTGSLNNTNPVLGPLANYGGPTLTMPLLSGSPAIDGGNPAAFPPTDQRGRARPFGAAPDIGAFESSAPFTIRGQVSGLRLGDEVSVSAGLETASTVNGGYILDVSPGGHTVTPQSPDYLFIPGDTLVTTGPDQLGINFKAYRWNALALDDFTNATMHVIFAATNGQTWQLLSSADFVQWTPILTNTIGPANYWELFLPIRPVDAEFFRAVQP